MVHDMIEVERMGKPASPVGKLFSRVFLGVDQRRSLPPFARKTFAKWFEERQGQIPPSSPFTNGGLQGGKSVVLFNDTFEFLSYNLAETVVLTGVKKRAVADKPDDPVIRQPVRSPSDKPLVHVVLLGFLGRAAGDVGLPDAPVYSRIFPVLVVVS